MFSRKSTIITTTFIAFMYLVFVPLVYAATEYKMTDYWPFKEGAWWEFNDGKIEITGTEEIDGISTFKSLETGSCPENEEIERGGEFNYFNDDANGFGSFSQNEDGSYLMVKISEPYVKKGDKTKASFKVNDDTQVTAITKLEGTANVVMPAGKFKRCLRFSIKIKGVHTDGSYSSWTENFYLAKGVGLVKAVRIKESANDVGCAFGPCCLDVFNGIRELKDYSN